MPYRVDTDTEDKVPTGRQDTSKASRDAIKKKNEYRRKIFFLIQASGYGLTCDEVEVALEMRHQTASCFIRFLTQDGLLEASSERRMTRAGRSAIVWRVKEKTLQMRLF